MDLTGQWLVERVDARADSGAMRLDVHLYAEDIETSALARVDRLHAESRMSETEAQRAEGEAETQWPWTARYVPAGWRHRLDIDGTDAGMHPCEVRSAKTRESDVVEARVVVRVLCDADLARVLVSRVGCPQGVASERMQADLPGLAGVAEINVERRIAAGLAAMELGA